MDYCVHSSCSQFEILQINNRDSAMADKLASSVALARSVLDRVAITVSERSLPLKEPIGIRVG